MKPMMPAKREEPRVFKQGSLNDQLDWAKSNMVAAREKLAEVGERGWSSGLVVSLDMVEAAEAMDAPPELVAEVLEVYRRVRAVRGTDRQVADLRKAMYAELDN